MMYPEFTAQMYVTQLVPMRKAGMMIDVNLAKTSVGKVMQRAEERNSKYGVIVGANADEVDVRDLKTRESKKIAVKNVAVEIKKLLGN